MRISDSQPSAEDSEVNSKDVDSSQKSDDDKQSAFSKVLAKKKGADQDTGPVNKGKSTEGELNPNVMMFPQGEKSFSQAMQAGQVDSKRIVALPTDLQQLVREISVVVNASGNQQVNIEMNSKTLQGLHVQIERRDGAVAIQFQSNSDQVAGLLSRNLESLSQGLAERGVNVAEIKVSSPRETAKPRDFRGQSNSEGRGQGGRQGGGR
jgi:flagellar hook-length control protein FliK